MSSWFFAGFVNYLVDGKYRLTGSAEVFLVARFAESGILEDYLKRTCGCNKTKTFSDSENYVIVSKSSSKVMEIIGAWKNDGATVQQYSYVDGQNQKFKIKHIKDDLYKFIALQSGKAISVLEGSATPLVQMKDTNGIGQMFRFIEGKENYYTIEYPLTKEIFEIKDNTSNDGAIFQLAKASNAANQLFRIIPDSTRKLCFYQDQIPRKAIDFIWDYNSPFWRTGGWLNSDKEYKVIVNEILFSPRYFLWNLREACTSTLRQLIHFDIGIGFCGENSPLGGIIKAHFRKDYNTFMSSIQNSYAYDFTNINRRMLATVVVSLFILILFFSNDKNKDNHKEVWFFCTLCFIAVLANAFVSGALANVADRLQSRIIWLIPFCAILVIYDSIVTIAGRIKEKIQ